MTDISFPSLTRRLGALARRWRGDRRGVAAVEFAFIAPVLLSLYFVTMEVAQGIEANKKVSRVGSMVADLVTQQQTTSRTELDAIMKIGESILQPYNRSRPKIVITAIEVTDEDTPKVKVVWSRKVVDGTYSADAAPGTTASVPEKLKTRGTFLVRVESYLDYSPVITWTAGQKETLGLAAAFDGIAMRETYYLRPRMSQSIACADC
ncbi:pilus assembly protein [Aquibium sp. A9E412]|uniref:TadE/TadG family type IV pilus assembly protein n=1 Tax=Aquibium sp. A9E412 TaxID=2976767 RepID=UPI0025B10AA6|nr:TadE/TadG family type IV pilus assembly protein [Aquibium sp. A9E412]MDN2567351.1 pilus assembly protein [Aquibium sp. A9E412]